MEVPMVLTHNSQLEPLVKNQAQKDSPLQYGEMSTTCPCCNSLIKSKTTSICFNYWKGRVFQGEKQVWLEPMEADLLKILLDSWPKVCSKEKLLVGLYGGNRSERISTDAIVSVYISKLRLKISPFNIRIQNSTSRGWWLSKKSTDYDLVDKKRASYRPVEKRD